MLRTSFSGDPNIGLYGFATESYGIIGDVRKKERISVEKELGVKVHMMKLFNTDFVGMFCAGNSTGFVVPELFFEEHLPEINFMEIKADFNALGNLIAINDNGLILSPLLRNCMKEFRDFFDIPIEVMTIAQTHIVGNACMATNRGCLHHSKATKREIKILEDVLGVECYPGTVNFGSPFVKSGIMANSKGFVASERSSGTELGRITEALGFL